MSEYRNTGFSVEPRHSMPGQWSFVTGLKLTHPAVSAGSTFFSTSCRTGLLPRTPFAFVDLGVSWPIVSIYSCKDLSSATSAAYMVTYKFRLLPNHRIESLGLLPSCPWEAESMRFDLLVYPPDFS